MLSNTLVWHHFRQPRHSGLFAQDEPDIITVVVGQALQGGIIKLQAQIQNGYVIALKQQVYGNAYLIASASWLVEYLDGKALGDVSDFSHHQVEDALQLPPNQLHCGVLAEQALQQLIDAHQQGI